MRLAAVAVVEVAETVVAPVPAEVAELGNFSDLAIF